MKGFVRSLLHTGSLLLAAVAFLAALISAFVVIALGLVWWREGRLGERDWPILRAGLAATTACAALGGTAFWLSRRAMGSRKEGVRSFTLVRTRSGRQEKFVTYFGAVIYLTVLGLWLWSRGSSGPWLRGAQVFGWLGLLFLGLHTRILLHELGHLGIARLLGLELLRTQIGTGPVLCHGRLASGFEWSWQLWPGGGLAEAVDLEERGTRGSILVELGRLEEAESLLQEVFQLTESPRDRGIAAFYLAVVAKHRVRPRELARFRRLATRLCPEIWLLKRVRAELPDSIPASPVMPFTQSADKLA